jgi:hypothetical protein
MIAMEEFKKAEGLKNELPEEQILKLREQQPKKGLVAKGKVQNKLDIKIHFEGNISEEMDNAMWQQLLKILGLEDNTYYT